MLIKIIEPVGWPCTLADAPPGPFVTTKNPDLLCFKSEYHNDKPYQATPMALNSAGEFFHCGGGRVIQPVKVVCKEVETG